MNSTIYFNVVGPESALPKEIATSPADMTNGTYFLSSIKGEILRAMLVSVPVAEFILDQGKHENQFCFFSL